MRIAQIAPLFEAVPPKLYGGSERVVSNLTEELVAMGHDVTLFASGDSVTAAKLDPPWPQALRLDPHDLPRSGCAAVREDAGANGRAGGTCSSGSRMWRALPLAEARYRGGAIHRNSTRRAVLLGCRSRARLSRTLTERHTKRGALLLVAQIRRNGINLRLG